jgi:hypothetical protein
MATNNKREGNNQGKLISRNLPLKRYYACGKDDHHGYAEEAYDEGKFETTPDGGNYAT